MLFYLVLELLTNGELIKMHWICSAQLWGWLSAWKSHHFSIRTWMMTLEAKLRSCSLSEWNHLHRALSIWDIAWNHWGIVPLIGDGWLIYLKKRYKTGPTGYSHSTAEWYLLKLFSLGWQSTGLPWLDVQNLFWIYLEELFSPFCGDPLLNITTLIW